MGIGFAEWIGIWAKPTETMKPTVNMIRRCPVYASKLCFPLESSLVVYGLK